jgi:hypothetical protein
MSAAAPTLPSVLETPSLRMSLLPFLIPSDLQSLMCSSKLVHPEHEPLGEEHAATPPTLVTILSIPGLHLDHVLPFLALPDFQSLVFSSKAVAHSFDLPLDDLSFSRYACGGGFACREHLLQAGKVGEERAAAEQCCNGATHERGPWIPRRTVNVYGVTSPPGGYEVIDWCAHYERGTFFCAACIEGEKEKTLECETCGLDYCEMCAGLEGGHSFMMSADDYKTCSPRACYLCPTHGFGCDAIWRCDFCSVEACYVEESGRVQLCAYCCGVFVCEDCRRTHEQAREGVIVSKCTDIACDGEEHCFPLCRNGIYPTDGELNPCTGVPCTDDE